MALNIYSGIPGSGKSYEVVANVVVPAIDRGRRVVSNIHGLNADAIRDYVLSKRGDKAGAPLGEIITVTNEQVQADNFFPKDQDDTQSVVRAGDQVVLDEVWRFWGVGDFIPKIQATFFREHRHYVAASTGMTTDIALITQRTKDLNPFIRGICEASFNMDKKRDLGMDRTYSVSMWKGADQFKSTMLSQQIKKYDKAIFPLYKSHAAAGATEVLQDKRMNLFNSPFMKFIMFGVPVLVVVCVGFLIHMYNSHLGTAKKEDVISSVTGKNSSGSSTDKMPPSINSSSDWRIAGVIETPSATYVVLSGSSPYLRYEPITSFQFIEGKPIWGMVDGKKVNTYSGGSSSSGSSVLGGLK